MKIKHTFIYIIYLSLLTSLHSITFEDAAKFYNDKEYYKAFEAFKELAQNDNLDAQYNLGQLYYKGIAVQKDKVQAFIWFSTAADKGHILSQNKLGTMYEFGEIEGIKDRTKAIEYYEKAAKSGYDGAQINLAMLYNGNVKKESLAKSFYWYQQAANIGNTAAMNNLANMYYAGHSVNVNYEKAFYWYLKASKLNDMIAQFNLSMMYFNGEFVNKDENKSLYWLKESSRNNYTKAQIKIADLYRKGGVMVSKNHKTAFSWYKKAASQNDKVALFYMGHSYFYGYGVKKDLEKAAYFMNLSEEAGYTHAKSFMKRNKLYY